MKLITIITLVETNESSKRTVFVATVTGEVTVLQQEKMAADWHANLSTDKVERRRTLYFCSSELVTVRDLKNLCTMTEVDKTEMPL